MSLRSRRKRKRLSMTSLIDVIFLLLLFFMLSSTFSRFAEVELQAGNAGGVSQEEQKRMLFLRISDAGISLNGQTLNAEALANVLAEDTSAATLLVSVTQTAKAQALTDVLVTLRPFKNLSVSVLEAL